MEKPRNQKIPRLFCAFSIVSRVRVDGSKRNGVPVLRPVLRMARRIIISAGHGWQYLCSFAGKGGYHDGCLSRQRVCAQRTDGLSAVALRRTAGGGAAAAGQVCIGSAAGGRIRGGGVLAGAGVFGTDAGQGGCGDIAGAGSLWRRAQAAAADAVVFRGVLRHGGVRAGIWTALRRCDSGSQRRFLYGCVRTGAAGSRRSGVCGADGGVPGLCPACSGGGAAADSGVCGRPGRGTDCAA